MGHNCIRGRKSVLFLWHCCDIFACRAKLIQVLDGEAWPALVTLGTMPGGHRAGWLQDTGCDSQLLHTPLSSPRDKGGHDDMD